MKVILFGATGMLGRYVLNILKHKYTILSILKCDFDIEKDNFVKLKLLLNNLEENDVVINCTGSIPQKNNDLRNYIKINSTFPNVLSEMCCFYKCNIIHISTDCVFSGLKGNYNENDSHDSKTFYGISKSLGENEKMTIIRTSIIGEEMYNKKSLLEWIISNKNKTINGYTNHYWNGISCLTLAKIIKQIIDNKLYWTGVKHIYSSEHISKFTLCEYINKIYNLNIKINPLEKDYKNLTLCSNFESLFKIDSIYDQLLEQYNYKINYGNFDTLTNCRFCFNNNLNEVIKFNDFPLAGCFLKNKQDVIYERNYPLTLLFCENCTTCLIKEIVNQDYLFKNINNNSYFYYSSTIPFLVEHFKNLYEKIITNYPSKKKILEIGCNDGILINNFIDKNYRIIGVDPSETIKNITNPNIITFNNFFDNELTNIILNEYGKQDIIIACNCLAHINDIYNIYSNIKKVLNDDGVLIIEVHYVKNVIDNCNFDFIYHEHMSYYSINTIVQICKTYDFFLENIENINTHGGSIRAFIKNKNDNNFYNSNIQKYLDCENNFKNSMNNMFDKVFLWKNNMIELIHNIKKSNILVGYGASGRTNMIINYIAQKFEIILDDSVGKVNSFMPYFHTEIKDSNEIYKNNNIKIVFILAWPYTNSIINKHIKFIEDGGQFIKILPNIEIINNNNYFSYL